MTSAKLALNRWSMGQVLMPAHFLTLQDALLQHIGLRSQLQGMPGYGVARLVWDEVLLGKGAVSVSALTVVFPSGELIDVPGNAMISNLNLSDQLEDALDVYLHVLRDPDDLGGDFRDDEVARLVHRVGLSPRRWLDDARQSMKLAELVRDMDGNWALGAYVPPLLQMGTSPFLSHLLADYTQTLMHLEIQLASQLADSFLGGDHVARLRRCQAAVYRLRALLADCDGQVHLHPYVVFSALRDFYLEACLLQGVDPDSTPAAYDHDDLSSCFGALSQKIFDKLRLSPGRSPRLPFARDGHRLIAGPLPEPLLRAREVYLLILRPFDEQVSLDDVKLASPARLELVHRHALTGVPFQKVMAPGFMHTFGVNADFYLLELGDEWAHALREGALCFFARPQLANVSAALTWRV